MALCNIFRLRTKIKKQFETFNVISFSNFMRKLLIVIPQPHILFHLFGALARTKNYSEPCPGN